MKWGHPLSVALWNGISGVLGNLGVEGGERTEGSGKREGLQGEGEGGWI